MPGARPLHRASPYRRLNLGLWRAPFRRYTPLLLTVAVFLYFTGLLLRDVHQLFLVGTEIRTMRNKLTAETRHNADLTGRVKALQSSETTELIARERLHLVKPGEQLFRLVPEVH